MREEPRRIIGYCSYCKDEIFEGEPYMKAVNEYGEEELLHKDCAIQSNTYYNELEF